MNTIAIIQARMGSTRLPGKVLMDLGGATVLSRVVQRVNGARSVNEIVVATSQAEKDVPIIHECQRLGVASFRGSENDVLDRYYQAAREFSADVIVRITSDCPLIDPKIVDETIDAFRGAEADYASNVFPRTFPRGLDTEVFTFAALHRSWSNTVQSHHREHVTPYMYEHPELFRLAFTRTRDDYNSYRWTLDTPEDMELIRAIYSGFDNRGDFGWQEIVAFMERNTALVRLNSHITQKVLTHINVPS